MATNTKAKAKPVELAVDRLARERDEGRQTRVKLVGGPYDGVELVVPNDVYARVGFEPLVIDGDLYMCRPKPKPESHGPHELEQDLFHTRFRVPDAIRHFDEWFKKIGMTSVLRPVFLACWLDALELTEAADLILNICEG